MKSGAEIHEDGEWIPHNVITPAPIIKPSGWRAVKISTLGSKPQHFYPPKISVPPSLFLFPLSLALLISLHRIPPLPHKRPRDRQARHRPPQVHLDDGPQPQTADGRRLLHDGQVALLVADVDQEAARGAAGGEEDGLTEGRLVAQRQAGEQHRVGGVRVQRPEEEEEHFFFFNSQPLLSKLHVRCEEAGVK